MCVGGGGWEGGNLDKIMMYQECCMGCVSMGASIGHAERSPLP